MSTFVPIRPPNAIDQAVFSLKLSCDIAHECSDKLESLKGLLGSDFDKIDDVVQGGVEIGPAGTKSMESKVCGIQCQSKINPREHLLAGERPDWILRVSSDIVQVSCLNYSSWDAVYEYVQSLLSRVLDHLSLDDSTSIIEVILQVNDVFVCTSGPDDFDLSGLFLKSDYLTENVWKQGSGLWHVHSGWFGSVARCKTALNVLNMSTRVEHTPAPSKHVTLIEHMQKCTLDGERVLISSYKSSLDTVFKELHKENKVLVDSLFTDEIKEQIGL